MMSAAIRRESSHGQNIELFAFEKRWHCFPQKPRGVQMSSGIKNISCERHIIAPEGESVWAGASYTRNTGQSIVENIRHEALHFSPQSGKQYFLRRAYRRYSHDNGKTWPITRHLFEKTPEQLAGEQIFPLNAFMLPAHDVLVDLFSKFIIDPSQPMFGIGNKEALATARLSTFQGWR